MNCCGNPNRDSQSHENHKTHGIHKHRHHLMMTVCLMLPIAVMIGLFFTGGFSGSGSLFVLIAALICPLMHLFMMPAMMKKGTGHHD